MNSQPNPSLKQQSNYGNSLNGHYHHDDNSNTAATTTSGSSTSSSRSNHYNQNNNNQDTLSTTTITTSGFNKKQQHANLGNFQLMSSSSSPSSSSSSPMTSLQQQKQPTAQSQDQSSSSEQSLKSENDKLNKRLLLLRNEYVKLQNKFSELNLRYDRLASSVSSVMSSAATAAAAPSLSSDNCSTVSGGSTGGGIDLSLSSNSGAIHLDQLELSTSFASKVLSFVGSLFNNGSYSDLTIEYGDSGKTLFGHKFVMQFRSEQWGVSDLALVDRLSLPDLSEEVAIPLFRWIYTGVIQLTDKSEDFILETVRFASRFDLAPLVEQCEEALIGFVRVENCIYFYQTSEELGLSRLCEYSSKLVTIYWDDLSVSVFAKASTQFLHRLFKAKSRFPLHKAIRIGNEDLIFLLLVDFDSQLSFKVNEFDNLGEIPLDLALRTEHFSIAKSLLEHQANVNSTDSTNWPLLHRYIGKRQFRVATFLLDNMASVGSTNPDGDSPLHLCADIVANDVEADRDVIQLARLLIEHRVDINLQNNQGNSALHRSIIARNHKLFDLLLEQQKINLEIRNRQYETPFAMALQLIEGTKSDTVNSGDEYYFAQRLLGTGGVSLETSNPQNGDSLLHQCARSGNERAALFLVENGANVNTINNRGETILHLASFYGFKNLVTVLLQKNANCNLLTLPPFELTGLTVSGSGTSSRKSSLDEKEKDEEKKDVDKSAILDQVYSQTPLHLAIVGGHESIIREILSYHDCASRKGLLDSALLTPDLNIKNSRHQTPLSLAIELRQPDICEMLINAGANIDVRNELGDTLLHQAISSGDAESAHFLLAHGADVSLRSSLGETYLQFAVRHQLSTVVRELCSLGADVNVRGQKADQSQTTADSGDCVLWEALTLYKESGNDEIASILVQHRCDSDVWHSTGEGFRQTLLHRALDENNELAAIFLIRSGCDIQCVRTAGPNGEGAGDCDGQTPLHMACSWGLVNVVEALLEHSADPNLQDNEGKTALQLAITNQNMPIVDILLNYPQTDLYIADFYGNSPFSLAIKLKNRETAKALCRRDPNVAEQTDGKGRNFLHLALEKSDYDSVLFLLDNKVNVNAAVQDSSKKSPIHLAAETGSEIILRTLVLAGSNVNELTMQNQTALHLAAELNKHQIVEILFDLNVDANLPDINGNCAIHLAALRGHVETSRVLLDRKSSIDIRSVNYRGQNPVHCLAISSSKSAAAIIFDQFVQACPDYELNARDNEGNTALLLAYMGGNSRLCRSIVKEGASLGMRNHHGVSIFSHVMPTRQLLTSLLDSLSRMPDWLDGPECLECGCKFNITNRRHHCRHCGRELCARCSSKEVIIMKFQQDKKSSNSRVCELCYDVLTVGVFN